MQTNSELSRETGSPSPSASTYPGSKDDPRLKFLGGVMRQLAKAAGVEAVLRLMDEFGGQKIYVPRGTRKITKDSPILALGDCGARKLVQLRGGEYLVVPNGQTLKLAERRQQIAAYLIEHPQASKDTVAEKFGVCRRVVQRIRAEQQGRFRSDKRRLRGGDRVSLTLSPVVGQTGRNNFPSKRASVNEAF